MTKNCFFFFGCFFFDVLLNITVTESDKSCDLVLIMFSFLILKKTCSVHQIFFSPEELENCV